MLFFFGVILCVGGLGFIGYLSHLSEYFYGELGPTTANVLVGVLSAIVDNIPVMVAVLEMNPMMDEQQWLLVTLTAGVGGSLFSIGSAAGVALMGQARYGNCTLAATPPAATWRWTSVEEALQCFIWPSLQAQSYREQAPAGSAASGNY